MLTSAALPAEDKKDDRQQTKTNKHRSRHSLHDSPHILPVLAGTRAALRPGRLLAFFKIVAVFPDAVEPLLGLFFAHLTDIIGCGLLLFILRRLFTAGCGRLLFLRHILLLLLLTCC